MYVCIYLYITIYTRAHLHLQSRVLRFCIYLFFFVFFTPFIPFNLHWLAFEIFLSIPAFGGHYNLSAFIAVYISIYTHRVVYPPTTALYKCQFSFTKTLFPYLSLLRFAASLCFPGNKAPPAPRAFQFRLICPIFFFFTKFRELVNPSTGRTSRPVQVLVVPSPPSSWTFSHYNTFFFCASSAVRISPSPFIFSSF